VGDPGEDRDRRRDGEPGIDQGVKGALHLTPDVADGTDLGDPEIRGDPPGGLEVDDAKRHLGEMGPHVLEGALYRKGHGSPE
jgi:hypothetical protein